MKKVIIFLVFVSLISDASYSQIFKSNEQFSGTIAEIQDSILKKEVLGVQNCLILSKRKNNFVKKISTSTKDSIFSFRHGMCTFKKVNNTITINSFSVWYKPQFIFPSSCYDDLKINSSNTSNEFPCKVFVSRKRTAYLFNCFEASIDGIPYSVIFISNVHSGFLGRVLIKSN